MCAVGIWVFGLLASAIIGGLLGTLFDTSPTSNNWFFGFFAGLFAFTCLRLLLTGSKNSK
jgi:hypothetical protein